MREMSPGWYYHLIKNGSPEHPRWSLIGLRWRLRSWWHGLRHRHRMGVVQALEVDPDRMSPRPTGQVTVGCTDCAWPTNSPTSRDPS